MGPGRPDRRRRRCSALFGVIETRVAEPMFPLALFRIRAFAGGNAASLLASIARGGLQFMLIIWLQGIWLPLHGYDYEDDPAVGRHLPAAADRRLPRRRPGRRLPVRPVRRRGSFAAGGLLVMAAVVRRPAADPGRLQLLGVRRCWSSSTASAAACSPRRTPSLIMSSVPAHLRGAASGMRATFQNAGMVLSIGVFFSLMVAGLASSLPAHADAGPDRAGRAGRRRARQVADLPPVGTLFAAFLGYNPIARAARAAACSAQLPAANAADADRPRVLPAPDLRPVPRRPGDRVLAGHRDGRGRRAGLAAARPPGRPAAAAASGPAAPAASASVALRAAGPPLRLARPRRRRPAILEFVQCPHKTAKAAKPRSTSRAAPRQRPARPTATS